MTDFRKILKHQSLWKPRPVGAELVVDRRIDGWIDGHRDMMKLIVAFRNFAKAPKNRNKKIFALLLNFSYANKLLGMK